MKGFLWGASTSATQVEGAWKKDGKGETIWDYYSKNKAIFNEHTCFDACNCYNRTQEDIALMKQLGLNSYRFSLSWARMIPEGEGAINQKGLDFYSKFVDDLLAAGIQPNVTLYHWDLPMGLYKQGGFSNRKMMDWMENYADLVGKTLGDRVKYFSVFNEPECIADFMYRHRVWDAVEPVESRQTTFEAMHNIMLANGASTRALRRTIAKDAKVGIVTATDVYVPSSLDDIEAAREAMFGPREDLLFDNGGFLDPICTGKHSEMLVNHFGLDLSFVKDGDMDIIKCDPDFIGTNIYTASIAGRDENGKVIRLPENPNDTYSSNMRRFEPESLYYGTKFLYERYGLPIYITENGVALSETIDQEGKLNDDSRVEYLRTHIDASLRAKADGVDLRGYYVWSLFDNFEWRAGYYPRFGIIHVNYETFKRTPKKSYWYYRDRILQEREKEGIKW